MVARLAGSPVAPAYLPMRPGEPPQSVVVGDPETLRPLFGGGLPTLCPLELGLEALVADAQP
jgi:hypothetical protein